METNAFCLKEKSKFNPKFYLTDYKLNTEYYHLIVLQNRKKKNLSNNVSDN